MSNIFISYAYADGSGIARELVAELEAAGSRCWTGQRDLQVGEDFPPQIVRAIRECRALVLLLTPGANVSRDVLQEVNLAHNAKKPIVPLIVQDTNPSDGLSYYLGIIQQVSWIDARTTAATLRVVLTRAGATGGLRERGQQEGPRQAPKPEAPAAHPRRDQAARPRAAWNSQAQQAGAILGWHARPAVLGIIAVLVAIVAVVAILPTRRETPAPELHEAPAATRSVSVAASSPSSGGSAEGSDVMQAATADLAARLAHGGGSDQDWELLAKSYDFQGRSDDARLAREHKVLSSAASGAATTSSHRRIWP